MHSPPFATLRFRSGLILNILFTRSSSCVLSGRPSSGIAILFASGVSSTVTHLLAMNAKDIFGRLMAVGLTSIIVVPAMMNIGVCTAVLPNTGLPLPFISYGGTNLIFTLFAVGLLISIHRQSSFLTRAEMPVINEKKQCVRI